MSLSLPVCRFSNPLSHAPSGAIFFMYTLIYFIDDKMHAFLATEIKK